MIVVRGSRDVLSTVRSLARIAAAIAVILGSYGAAEAQTALADSVAKRARPDLDPIGIVMGPADSFLFFPKLTVEVERTNNLFRAETDTRSDEILLISPEFTLRSDWDLHTAALKVKATRAKHRDNGSENWIDYEAALDGRIDVVEKARLNGLLKFSRKHEDRGSPDDPDQDAPALYHVGRLELTGTYNLDAILLRSRFRLLRSDYRDSGAVNNDDRDRFEYNLRSRAGYEWIEGSSVFVEISGDLREFDDVLDDDGVNRSSEGYELLLGNTLDLSGVLFAELGLGYRSQTFDDADLKRAEGFSFLGKLVWNPTDILTVKGLVRRLVRETTVTGASSTFTSRFELSADYELLHNVILDAAAKFELQDFRGIDREDELLQLKAGAKYLIGPNFTAGAKFLFEERRAEVADGSYSVSEFKIFISTQL